MYDNEDVRVLKPFIVFVFYFEILTFKTFFTLRNKKNYLVHCFERGKNIQNVGYKLKASQLLSKLLIFYMEVYLSQHLRVCN